MMMQEFGVGTQFMSKGRHPRLCTVVDKLTTTNLAGKVVKVRYIATHTFLGKLVRDHDVSPVAVARGLMFAVPAAKGGAKPGAEDRS